MGDTSIVVKPARKTQEGEWEADATIHWPDGSRDESAAGVRGRTKDEAEQLAAAKACERWFSINEERRSGKHPAPSSRGA